MRVGVATRWVELCVRVGVVTRLVVLCVRVAVVEVRAALPRVVAFADALRTFELP